MVSGQVISKHRARVYEHRCDGSFAFTRVLKTVSYVCHDSPCALQCLPCHQRGSSVALDGRQHQRSWVLCLEVDLEQRARNTCVQANAHQRPLVANVWNEKLVELVHEIKRHHRHFAAVFVVVAQRYAADHHN